MGEDNTSDKQLETDKYPNRWKPGESGNPAGRPPLGQSMTELMREFLEGVEDGQKLTRKQQLIRKIALLAYKDGDFNAMKLIWNYLDGLPKQTIETDSTVRHDSTELESWLKNKLTEIKDVEQDG